jgi:hypothetical protein
MPEYLNLGDPTSGSGSSRQLGQSLPGIAAEAPVTPAQAPAQSPVLSPVALNRSEPGAPHQRATTLCGSAQQHPYKSGRRVDAVIPASQVHRAKTLCATDSEPLWLTLSPLQRFSTTSFKATVCRVEQIPKSPRRHGRQPSCSPRSSCGSQQRLGWKSAAAARWI